MEVFDLIYKRGETTEGKPLWGKAGSLLKKDNGKYSVKIDAIPAGNWDGWLQAVERTVAEEVESDEPF